MDRIKSAYEMALERFQQRGAVPRAEIDRLEYKPVGGAIAAGFLRDQDYDLIKEISKYPAGVKKYIIAGIQETFLHNLLPPKDKSARETNKRVLAGLLLLKEDKAAAQEVFGRLKYLFQYYEQSLVQAYSRFKEEYSARVGPQIRSMEQKTGGKLNIDLERQPGFREEWLKLLSRIDSQYMSLLAEQKEILRQIS